MWIKDGYASYAAEEDEELRNDKMQFCWLEEDKMLLLQSFSSERWFGKRDWITEIQGSEEKYFRIT